MPAGRITPWRVCPRPEPGARLRLYCLPPMGRGSEVFAGWGQALAPEVEVHAVRLPGRGTRLREPYVERFDELSSQLVEGLRGDAREPVCFLGYSMGGLVAFELARAWRRVVGREPAHLIVCATPPPSMLAEHPLFYAPDRVSTSSDDEIVAWLEGVDPSLDFSSWRDDFRAVILRIVRADLRLLLSYAYAEEPPFEHTGVTIFGGRSDPLVSVDQLQGWASETVSEFRVNPLEGAHNFVTASRDTFLGHLRDELQRVLERL